MQPWVMASNFNLLDFKRQSDQSFNGEYTEEPVSVVKTDDMMILKQKTIITWHKMKIFKEMF